MKLVMYDITNIYNETLLADSLNLNIAAGDLFNDMVDLLKQGHLFENLRIEVRE